jgi:hypothetical protein
VVKLVLMRPELQKVLTSKRPARLQVAHFEPGGDASRTTTRPAAFGMARWSSGDEGR